jgi:hypothetical protein
MMTDEEWQRLKELKRTARQREPLPESDRDRIPDDVAAACRLLANYMLSHPSSAVTWLVTRTLGDQFDELVITLWSLARATKDKREGRSPRD